MLDETQIRSLVGLFGLEATSKQAGHILSYLELLLRWNRRLNLTAIRSAEECVTRHFGESLYLSKIVRLKGSLLDVGSGAGFPGLALRIAFPDLITTLLEPVGKKRAFLKEVARACEFSSVEVRSERLEEFARREPRPAFNTITARAVGQLERLVPVAASLLRSNGRLCLWVGHDQGSIIEKVGKSIKWSEPAKLPLSRDREIWIGERFT